MGKLRVVVLFVLISLPVMIDAQEAVFGWNIGNINLFYDALNKKGEADLEIFRFNWRFNHFSIGFNLLDIHSFANFDSNRAFGDNGGINRYSILPLEMAFVPLNIYDWWFLSVYGKAGWLLTQYGNNTDNGIYGSIGIKFFLFHEYDDIAFSYSPYLSFFTEYDTYNRLKMGLGMDLSALIFAILQGEYANASSSYIRRD